MTTEQELLEMSNHFRDLMKKKNNKIIKMQKTGLYLITKELDIIMAHIYYNLPIMPQKIQVSILNFTQMVLKLFQLLCL